LEGLAIEDVGIFYGYLVHLRAFGIFYGHLVHFVVIWYIFPVLVFCTKKNLATLLSVILRLFFRGGAFAQDQIEKKNCLRSKEAQHPKTVLTAFCT
jgi:hypothetical protein